MTESEVETREVTGFLDALEIIEELYDATPGSVSVLWWRGQGSDWSLVPKVFRDESRSRVYEATAARRFRRLARARHDDCPDRDERASWLFLMQHYGAPTRLLDWTESPLVGLYFAVEEAEFVGGDGVLWALNPFFLNGILFEQPHLFLREHGVIRRLVGEAFSDDPAELDTAAALVGEELDVRMMLQLAGFTIHGSPKPFEQLRGVGPALTKLVIRAKHKPEIYEWVNRLGITRRNLFPDLSNLARSIRGSTAEEGSIPVDAESNGAEAAEE